MRTAGATRAIARPTDADLWRENQNLRGRLDVLADRSQDAELRARALASILRGWSDGRLDCDPRACADIALKIADSLAAA
jgi:hypothetical protein